MAQKKRSRGSVLQKKDGAEIQIFSRDALSGMDFNTIFKYIAGAIVLLDEQDKKLDLGKRIVVRQALADATVMAMGKTVVRLDEEEYKEAYELLRKIHTRVTSELDVLYKEEEGDQASQN